MPQPLQPLFLAPQPPSYLPPAPLAPAIVRPLRLTGDRLTFFQILLGWLVLFGILGAIASFSTGYEIYTNSGHELVKSRNAGAGGSAFWCLAGAALAALAIARPTRRTVRIVSWSYIPLFFVGVVAIAATQTLFSLEGLSFSKHTEETGAVGVLVLSLVSMTFAGPVLVVTQWLLFRRERHAVR